MDAIYVVLLTMRMDVNCGAKLVWFVEEISRNIYACMVSI
jgi:hypothetical protein